MFTAIPLLTIIVITYNVIALLTGPELSRSIIEATLPSGAAWTLTLGDLLILIGIALLFLEIVKATRSRRAGMDHAMSMVLFVIALLEFLLVPACGTDVFLIITALTLTDVIAGFSVSLSTARRDIAIN
ncbi:MAG: hypothetical protein JNM48_11725 [Rhodospirillales bacterium]|nr:hypothetical protein [Rhodospirillales bacterium]